MTAVAQGNDNNPQRKQGRRRESDDGRRNHETHESHEKRKGKGYDVTGFRDFDFRDGKMGRRFRVALEGPKLELRLLEKERFLRS